MELQTILVPVDFSPASGSALPFATSIADQYGAEIVLLHVTELPSPELDVDIPNFDMTQFLTELQEDAEKKVEQLVATLEAPGSVRGIVETGRAAPTIVEVARNEGAGLIVLPTHSREGLERLILGSVAEKVVRLASCPVLTVHPKGDGQAGFHPDKVMFATDFSEHAGRAFGHATSLAHRYGAELLLVNVVISPEFDPAIPEWSRPEVPTAYTESLIADATRQMEKLEADAAELGITARARVRRGVDAARTLVQTAEEEDAELIVVSTCGHTGIRHLFLGSTAERVVRYADCAVWTERLDED